MVEFTCEYCGEKGEKPPSRINHGDNFCNRQCLGKYQRNRVEVDCFTCGDTFERPRSRVHRSDAVFCSNECKSEYRKNRVELECFNCGKSFERKKSEAGRQEQTFCSRECKGRSRRGEDNPNWKDGRPDYYGSNWREMREKTLQRDNHQCMKCGDSGEDESLHVHHIKPIRTFDEPENANFLDNLVSLCVSCHHEMERKPERVQRRVLGI